MSDTVQQIKDRLSVVDVLGSYIKLEKAGKNFKAKCPFHNEKTPSFFVSPERDSYYCFGCGAKGDIFTFTEHFEGVEFVGALKLLAAKAGVELSPNSYQDTNPHKRLYEALEDAAQFFENEYKKNNEAQKYVASRGSNEKTARAFRFGFAPAEWRALHDHLIAKKYTLDELQRAGLIKQKASDDDLPKETGYYDVFRSRLMQPVFDASGRVVAFSGRILGHESEKTPKYINSPETPIFKKSETLYGFDRAKLSVRKYNFSILVEGPIDLVMAHQAGFTNTVAVMGTAFTAQHVEKLRRLSTNIVIALDADDAGLASAKKTARLALAAGMDVKIAALPDGKDPGDVLKENPDIWKKSVREASHIVDFLLLHLTTHHVKDARALKQRIRNDVLPYVSLIENKIDQAHFITRIATALAVDESAVVEELAKVALVIENPLSSNVSSPESAEGTSRKNRIIRQLAGITAWQEKSATPRASVSQAYEAATRLLGTEPRSFFTDDDIRALAFEAEVAFPDGDILDKHLEEMLRHLAEDMLRERFAQNLHALAIAEREGAAEEAGKLLLERKKLTEELNHLYT